jgi:hypothetical protein
MEMNHRRLTGFFFKALEQEIQKTAPDFFIKVIADENGNLHGIVPSNDSFPQMGEDLLDITYEAGTEVMHVNTSSFDGVTTYQTPPIKANTSLPRQAFFEAVTDRIIELTRANFERKNIIEAMQPQCN